MSITAFIIIREIAERCGGSLETRVEGSLFVADLILKG